MGKQGPFDLIIPEAAHPGFDKAAHLMGANAIRLTSSTAYRADTKQIKTLIGPNAILLAASAPSFPFGITDPIDELAVIAKENGLWLHVDACHGGFVLPFARQLGYATPDFDFSIDGVTSLSVDLHKLGYANKGASALLLADTENEKYQRYTFDKWPGGRYSTMGLMGSRSAGGMASAWAMIRILGQTGYREIVSEILTARDQLLDGLTQIKGIRVLGNPDAYLIAFASDTADIMALSEGMLSKGWLTGHLTRPRAIHLFLDRENATSVSEFLEDLSDTMREVSEGRWAETSVDTDYTR
jgi:glutamate/tyrosine decarboxylase-like PLP-dependent enzyme